MNDPALPCIFKQTDMTLRAASPSITKCKCFLEMMIRTLDAGYSEMPFFSRSFLALSTESMPVLFLIGANSFSRSTS